MLIVITSNAQKKRDFFTMVKGDSLAIFLTEPPSANEVYNVYRKTDTGFVLLTTEEPIRAIVDPTEARLVLDKDWDLVSNAIDSDDEMEVIRQIRSKTFRGALLSLVSNGAAKVSGRWFVDSNVKRGNSYTYKIIFETISGRTIDSLVKSVRADEIIPNSPTDLVLETGDKQIKLKWKYPKWNGDFSDLGFRYNIYRKEGEGKYKIVNETIVIRDDNSDPEFIDLWLEEGIKYSYKVTISDPIGNESKPSKAVEILLVDKTPPSIVTNVMAGAYKDGIKSSWNMSTELDVVGYNIFRATALKGPYKKINKELIPFDKPFYRDSLILEKKQYFYTISALDKSGNEGKRSNPNSVYLKDQFAPDAPTNLTYKIVDNKVHLSWKPSFSKDLNGYFIYKSERATGMKSRITISSHKGNSFIDEGEGNGFGYGAKFYYSITAQDSSNNESDSISITVFIPDVEPPLPPSNLSITSKGDYILVDCGMSPSLDAKKYLLNRSELNKKEVEISNFTSAPFHFADTTIVKGVSYIYSVSVIDTANNMSKTSIKDTIVFTDYSPPPAPRNVKVKFVNNKVELKWLKSIDFDMAGYNVYRSDYPTGTFILLNNKLITETKFTDNSGSKKYYYQVKAVDTSGNESKYDKTVSPK
jgi:fibronectin type 3 domain-containing protein